VRHEYVGGMVYAMVGTTKRHNRIAGNVYARLLAAARGGPCRVYMETIKLRVEDVIYYPDVMVACGAEDDDPLRACVLTLLTGKECGRLWAGA
jgi:Uma2 family endonuclease